LFVRLRDLSHRERISTTIRAVQDSYSALSETTTDAIVQINDDLKIIYANMAVRIMFGYDKDELIQQDFATLFPRAIYDRHQQQFRQYFLIDGADRKATRLSNIVEILGLDKTGDIFPVEISFGNSKNVLGERIVTCIIRDVTERKRTERRLRFLAYHDKLTEIGNRDLLYVSLKQYLTDVERHPDEAGAVLFLDMDGFKRINDTMGHDIGDQILRESARRLRNCLRESDSVYRFSEHLDLDPREELFRFGGDEFVILLAHLKATDDAGKVAQRIIDAITVPFDVPDGETGSGPNLGVSIGIAMIPADGEDAMNLIRSADVAMYKAKEVGNRYVFYSDDLNKKVDERLEIEAGLRNALATGGLELHYQPLVDAKGNVKGAEALLRWNDPVLGPISPGVFIRIAEETGLILAVGDWVLEEACRQLVDWRKAGHEEFYVSVNLSVKQFNQDDLVEKVTETIRSTGADPANLRIEITESSLLKDPDDARRKMAGIKEQNPGIRIAIDDFGAGYSSLSYLSELPVDILKIDQSFVMRLYTGRHNPKIVNTIIALAHSLHLDVIAEGVENEAQLHYLSTKECRLFQGYYFARPMPSEELTRLLDEADAE
jgi:PAS domain S-box-containing protein